MQAHNPEPYRKQRQEKKKEHSILYIDKLRELNDLYFQGDAERKQEALGNLDIEWTNIEDGHTWATTFWKDDGIATKLCIDYLDAGKAFLFLRRSAQEKIQWLTIALHAARKLGQRETEIRCLSDLGLAYTDVGKSQEALNYLQQALASAEEGENRHGKGKYIE